MIEWLRHGLRDVPLVRGATIRLLTATRVADGARHGVLFLSYHDMRASERGRFEKQLGQFRNFGDVVSLDDATRLLADEPSGRYVCLTFDDGRRGAYDHAFPILAAQKIPAAYFIVAGWLDEKRPGIIDWDECRRLAAGGMDIGSHSLNHYRLADLSMVELEHQLVVSRARIEAELGRQCLHFACPWGQPIADYRPEREPKLARQAGYRSFFTTVARRAGAGDDPWALPRVRMEPGWGSAELRYAFSR